MFEKVKLYLNGLYDELVGAKDSPHLVAFSFAVGVFLGILPFTGVLAAIGVALYFKLNKASAVLGAALTNTWLGLIVLGLAISVGGWCLGVDSAQLQHQWSQLTTPFDWKNLFSPGFLSILMSLAIGYFVLSLFFAFLSYWVALFVIYWHRGQRR